MSEQAKAEENTTISEENETKTVPITDTNDENKTNPSLSKSDVASVEPNTQINLEKPSNADVISASNVMDVNETHEIIPNESSQAVVIGIESVPEHDISSEQPHVSSDIETAQNTDPNTSIIDSTPNESQPTNEISDEKMESETIAAPKPQKKTPHPQIPQSIGSLKLLDQYGSSSDEDEDSSSNDDDDSADSESESNDSRNLSNNEVLGAPAKNDKELNTLANNILNSVMSRENYREASSDSSDSDSDDSVECLGSIAPQTIDITNDEEIQEFLDACEEAAPPGHIKAKGELGIKDLPPIEELTITVGESECVELGKISGIVDTLVLVESLPGFAAVDIDTVLFLEKGNRTLGQVFDVMGNVSSPIYCVRFNTEQDIHTKNIKAGLQVYVAPQTQYTNFIVLSDLMKQKGCDASWENDHEAPDDFNEYSDDEAERLARREHNQKQRNRNRSSESSEQTPNKVSARNESNPNPNTNANANANLNSNSNANSNRRGRRPKFNRPNNTNNKPPTRFYKDNRGYSLPYPDSGGLYHQRHHHQHQQRMQSAPHNYSWHTAAMQQQPPPSAMQSSSTMPQTSFGSSNHAIGPNMYPNPFAMQANYGPFNLHAFPPLPPPMSSLPPSTQSPYNHKNSNSFQQQ